MNKNEQYDKELVDILKDFEAALKKHDVCGVAVICGERDGYFSGAHVFYTDVSYSVEMDETKNGAMVTHESIKRSTEKQKKFSSKMGGLVARKLIEMSRGMIKLAEAIERNKMKANNVKGFSKN